VGSAIFYNAPMRVLELHRASIRGCGDPARIQKSLMGGRDLSVGLKTQVGCREKPGFRGAIPREGQFSLPDDREGP
jgi:hypothetical protein